LRYPRESRICFIECGGNSSSGWQTQPLQSRVGHMHGLVSCSEWTGVRLSGLLHEAGIRDQANWLIAEGADAAGVVVSLPLSKATGDTLAALYQNGERLRPENGYPLRLVVPGWEGIVNLKWLRRLTLAREPLMSRFETAKYTDGIARQFSFEMGVKSVITEPSPGLGPDGAGHYEIRGLAWSGAGRISKVEVSVDAGETWEQARLQEPVLPASLTRFRIPWHWHGRRTILLSRAVDERGHQQPTRTELVNQHGAHQYYHYHAIVSWEVEAGGGVRHVYL
jgi:sulfane dehydrogenase subunit SoxC